MAFLHRQGVDLAALDDPITKDEVWANIKSLPADLAPGLDGYTGRFYKACWPIIKHDFMAAIILLQQGDTRKLWLLNSAYLTLIPKKADATCAKDYRPISLIHSFVNSLPRFWQTGWPRFSILWFYKSKCLRASRCTHDNYMLVQQTIKSLHKHKVPSLFLKLDISKAFDSVLAVSTGDSCASWFRADLVQLGVTPTDGLHTDIA